MNGEEPKAQCVHEIVHSIGIRDAINRGVERQSKYCCVSDMTGTRSILAEEDSASAWSDSPVCDARYHCACAHHLDQQDVSQYRHEVVVRREGSKPLDRQVVYPNNQNGHVYGHYPKHEDKHRMRVIVKVVACRALGFLRTLQSPDACANLHNAEHHVCKLIWNDRDDHQDENAGGDYPLVKRQGARSSAMLLDWAAQSHTPRTYLVSSETSMFQPEIRPRANAERCVKVRTT